MHKKTKFVILFIVCLFTLYCAMLLYISIDSIKSQNYRFQQTLTIASQNFAHKVRSRNLELFKNNTSRKVDLVSEIQNEYDFVHPDLFKDNYVDSLLKIYLTNENIILNYEYAIFHGDTIVLKSSNANFNKPIKKDSFFTYTLIPNDNLRSDSYILKIYFPNKQMIGLSLLKKIIFLISFAILILLLFLYVIYHLFSEKKTLEIKNDFISNLSHEIKTPIATISLSLDALYDDDIIQTEVTRNYYLNVIQQENNRMKIIVEQLLQSAIFEKNTIDLKSEDVDIHNTIREIVNNNNVKLSPVNGEFSINLRAEHHIVVGDPSHLYNVFNNLVDNAIKYSPKDPKIKIQSQIEGDYIAISIIDNGIGIAKMNQSQIFTRLYRVPQDNIHNVKGFGLGLGYVKKMVEMHKGTVRVRSELKKGSTFTVYLPYKK